MSWVQDPEITQHIDNWKVLLRFNQEDGDRHKNQQCWLEHDSVLAKDSPRPIDSEVTVGYTNRKRHLDFWPVGIDYLKTFPPRYAGQNKAAVIIEGDRKGMLVDAIRKKRGSDKIFVVPQGFNGTAVEMRREGFEIEESQATAVDPR